MPRITPFLWFDDEAEQAAEFYVRTFNARPSGEGQGSRIVHVARYNDAGPGTPGSAMTVQFELDGQEVVALNGGPGHPFTDAFSFVVHCLDQDEVDHFWKTLADGGEEGPCGWLKDRWGLSWQVVPDRLTELLNDPDPGRAERAMRAMLQMGKIEIAELEAAADGV